MLCKKYPYALFCVINLSSKLHQMPLSLMASPFLLTEILQIDIVFAVASVAWLVGLDHASTQVSSTPWC
jgi:hypothetical protein